MTGVLSRSLRTIAVTAIAGGAAVLVMLAPSTHAHADPSLADVERELAKRGAELEFVIEQANAAKVELDAIQAQITGAEAQLPQLETRVSEAYERTGEIAGAVYKGGQASGLNALLGSGGPENLINQLLTIDRLTSGNQRDIDSLSSARAKLSAEQGRLKDLRDQKSARERIIAEKKAVIQQEVARLKELQAKLGGGSRASRDTARPATPYVPGKAGVMVNWIYAQIGKDYEFAGTGPDSFDCSGLTMMAYKQIGVGLPHSATKQQQASARISRAELQPGDLVFYYTPIGHVAMYVGSGKVVHAPQEGQTVTERPIDYVGSINSYGRVAYG